MKFLNVNSRKNERIGELFILAETVLFGLFPIIAGHATRLMPPVLFAGVCTIVAAICLFFYMLVTGQLKNLINKKAFLYILGVTAFVVIIPSIFIFIGTSKTSSVNTAILLQTELLFTFLIYGFFGIEKINLQKIIGAAITLIGATVVLFNGVIGFKLGDILIIAGTLFYPIGNIFAKKALEVSTPARILFIRNIIGGFFLIGISIYFENYNSSINTYVLNNLRDIALAGILIFFISKVLWYEGMRRIDVSKALSIAISAPAFSLVYAAIFLKELPTIYQMMGLFVVMAGLLILTQQKGTHIEELK